MKTKLAGLFFGAGAGFVIAWSGLSNPEVIRSMLLLREAHAFLLMGAVVVVAGVGARALRALGGKAVLTGEPISWTTETPSRRHVVGSVLFGAGWALADTCPGGAAVMLGGGRLGGLAVVLGILSGVALQGLLSEREARRALALANPAGV